MIAFDYKLPFQSPIDTLELAENPNLYFNDNGGNRDLAYYDRSFLYFPQVGYNRMKIGEDLKGMLYMMPNMPDKLQWRFKKMDYRVQTSGACSANFDVTVTKKGEPIPEWSQTGLVSGCWRPDHYLSDGQSKLCYC